MRLLVTGGRRYNNADLLCATLDAIHRKHGITKLIHGATPTGEGADWLADAWALEHDIPIERYAVDPVLDGQWPGAGPRRNVRMIRDGKPDYGVAFPGDGKSAGTRNCVKQARAAGIFMLVVIDWRGNHDDSQRETANQPPRGESVD